MSLYDPQEENNPKLKAILDTPLYEISSNYIYEIPEGETLRNQINELSSLLKKDKFQTVQIRDIIPRSFESQYPNAYKFLFTVYAQLKEFTGDELLMHTCIPACQGYVSGPERVKLLENGFLTIGYTTRKAQLLASLIGDKAQNILSDLRRMRDEKLRERFPSEYTQFLQLNLWTQYEMDLNLLVKPLILIYGNQKVKELLEPSELADPFGLKDYDKDSSIGKALRAFQIHLGEIEHKDIIFSDNMQKTTISSYFSHFSIPFFCLKLQVHNTQKKIELDDTRLSNFLQEISNEPEAHAVMFRVVCEYLKIRATNDGILQNIKYEQYSNLIRDPLVKSFLPSPANQQEFLTEMSRQTYKLGILNDQISEKEAIKAVHDLIYVCQMDDTEDFNYFEKIEDYAFIGINAVYHFFKSVTRLYLQQQQGLGWMVIRTLFDYFAPQDITKDGLYNFINGMISIYDKCKDSDHQYLRDKAAEIARVTAAMTTTFSLFSKILHQLPQVMVSQVDWVTIVDSFIDRLDELAPSCIYANILSEFLKSVEADLPKVLDQEQQVINALISPSLASVVQEFDYFSQTVYVGVSFRLAMARTLNDFDKLQATSKTYIDITTNLGLNLPEKEGMTPGKWALFILFPVPFLIGSAIAESLPDRVTHYYEYALSEEPRLQRARK